MTDFELLSNTFDKLGIDFIDQTIETEENGSEKRIILFSSGDQYTIPDITLFTFELNGSFIETEILCNK